jgi:hypothetical protein
METPLRIAICISGQLRNWDIMSLIYTSLSNIKSSVQYDFFLSTWNTHSYDLSKTSFDIIYNEFDELEWDFYAEQPFFLLQEVHKLRNKFEIENSIEYDCVISTRPDMFFNNSTLTTITNLCNSDNHDVITPKVIYTNTGTIIHRNHKTSVDRYFTDDNIYVGHPDGLDVLSNMCNDLRNKRRGVYLDKNNELTEQLLPTGLHEAPAVYLLCNGIINNELKMQGVVVRDYMIPTLTEIKDLTTIYSNKTIFLKLKNLFSKWNNKSHTLI